MQLINFVGLAALLAGTAIAAPAAEAGKPPKPPKPTGSAPTTVVQSNVCGNNVTPYCCNGDNAGNANCNAMGKRDLSFLLPPAS
jgi:hypothetical protein